MRILTLGDLHIKLNNLTAVSRYFTKLKEYLENADKYDFIIILGDTLDSHEKVYTQCLIKMQEYLDLCTSYSTTYVIVGNHEYINNDRHLNSNHPFLTWKNVYNIVDIPILVEFEEFKFVVAPYVPNGLLASTLDEFVPTWRETNIIFAHQSINGVKMGAIVEKNAEDWDGPFLVCGHIHDKQQIGDVFYPGSIFTSGDKAHTISEFVLENDDIYMDDIDLKLPRTKTIKVNVDDYKLPTAKYYSHINYRVVVIGSTAKIKWFRNSIQLPGLISKYPGCNLVYKPNDVVIPTTTGNAVYKPFTKNILDNLPENLIYLHNEIFDFTA